MVDQSTETKKLTDGTGTITLSRNVTLKYGPKESVTGDRMLLEHITGETEDVVAISEAGVLKVKRVVQQMKIQSATPAVEASSSWSYALEDLNAADEKRMLAAYNSFSSSE